MFPSSAALKTRVAETNFAARKQIMFLPEMKNNFASRTQLLRPKHMFTSLAFHENDVSYVPVLIIKIFPSNGERTTMAES